MKRLFFALWPANETRKQIDIINQSLCVKRLKKVKYDNFHVTLVFLGNVSAESEALIRQRMKNISTQAFTISFDQLSFWRKPGLLCLTTQPYNQPLFILVNALKRELGQCGMTLEDRPYKPHISLARKAHRPIDIDIPPIEWQVKSFGLVESLSTPEGVYYRVVQTWGLG